MTKGPGAKPKPIIIVQGGQWGSEGKGMVSGALCERRKVDFAVRTGGVNAGHTVYKDGVRYVNQQLPTGWVAGDNTSLVIGPGAYVNPFILHDEIEMVRRAGYGGAILVDPKAGLHLPDHTERARMSNRHYTIGATSKGCSEAVIDRIRMRGSGGHLLRDWYNERGIEDFFGGQSHTFAWADTVDVLHTAYDRGDQILIEGTQGSQLDLYLGPYPYTTHKQTIASQWVTEAGLSPGMEYEIVLVARTYPIRVAGNSGPMPNEIDWPTLTEEINGKLLNLGRKPLVDPSAVLGFLSRYDEAGPYATPEIEASERNRDAWNACGPRVQAELAKLWEFTTVTKKLRRIARLDLPGLAHTVKIERPSWIALTFINYEFPEMWGITEPQPIRLSDWTWIDLVGKIHDHTGVPVLAMTTGPESKHYHSI